jgi:hypothetical protein
LIPEPDGIADPESSLFIHVGHVGSSSLNLRHRN